MYANCNRKHLQQQFLMCNMRQMSNRLMDCGSVLSQQQYNKQCKNRENRPEKSTFPDGSRLLVDRHNCDDQWVGQRTGRSRGWLGSTEANRMTTGLLTQLTGLMLCCCNQQPPTSASAIQNSNFPGAKCIH